MQVRHRMIRILLSLLLAALLAGGGAAGVAEDAKPVDFAASVALDMSSETVKAEARVHTYVDGDTTHFTVSDSAFPYGILKARYIGINTPESTGKVEPWGKQASRFTREKLEGAAGIIVESDTGEWNTDSTGSRQLVWVWYTPDGTHWRNLNIELLQEGLAIANSSAQNRYGDTCMAAIAQARSAGLRVYSAERDPEFYYGDAVEVTLRELRLNAGFYEGVKVAFEGVVTVNHSNSVYVEALDGETGLHFGLPVYYGYNLSGGGMEILRAGNLVRIVGTFQYYEAGGAWQVAGITYRMMKPDDPGNIRLISSGHGIPWTETDAAVLMEGTVALEPGEEDEGYEEYGEFDRAFLSQATTVAVSPLTVQGGYTSIPGTATLWCLSGRTEVQLHLDGALNENGVPYTVDELRGKTVSVRGVVGKYNGDYQIDVFTPDGLKVLQ
ncbi:MAG: thermonuclease family protein [Clostridia bacterium]|nr:thermonuclease family protein [Clostridia bacterium]